MIGNGERWLWAGGGLAVAILLAWLARPHPLQQRADPPSAVAPEQPTAAVVASAVAVSRPHVVLISLDTTRADHWGCYGYQKPTTPHLDQLAKQGVLFRNCRSQAPWTLPSHMSVFTSLTPTQHGVDNLNMTLPGDIPTLAELLHEAGYQTAGLVNDGQMKAHWGFSRGFETWREFPVDTPAGACPNLTSQALAWLAKAPPDKPQFLFLHYYDAHDPYAAPDEFRKKLGTTLTGDEARELCFRYREPAAPLDRPTVLADLVAAYDAELAWLDSELDRLLSALPPETLVVIFGDHGESFKEHGWMLHGATLFEEETHVPLLVRLPNKEAAGLVSEESVMLLDVAPTILARCGVRIPAMQQGKDLAPVWRGERLSPRIVPAETKAVLEGRMLYSATLFPFKGIYSVLEGKYDVFRLPDETRPLTALDAAVLDSLRRPLKELLAGEQFWILRATGNGEFSASITARQGTFALFIPAGLDLERDQFSVSPDGKTLTWQVHPRGTERAPALLFKPTNLHALLTCDLQHNGDRKSAGVFLGPQSVSPAALPLQLDAQFPTSDPWQAGPPATLKPGFHLQHFQGSAPTPTKAILSPLDAETLRQLKSLGYLR